MKKICLAIVIAVIAAVGAALPAQAQLRFGLKAGVAVNSLHFNESTFDAENRAGFTGGAMLEFTVPVTGIGLDASVMYVRRNSAWMTDQGIARDNRDYIDVPVNFKWRISVPLINKIVRPFVTTGPSFSFLTSKKVNDVVKNRTFDTAWNFGFGLELFQKVQVGASYGLGLTKAIKAVDGDYEDGGVSGRNRYWTITAAWMF